MSWTANLSMRPLQLSQNTPLNDNSSPSDGPVDPKRRQAAQKYPFQPFPANIEIAEDELKAIKFARAEYSPSPEFPEISKRSRMALWSNCKIDKSRKDRYGIGVAYMSSRDRWVDLEYLIQRDVKDWVAEIAAISKALQIAAEEVSKAETKPTTVIIYTGSRRALERLKKGIVGIVPHQKFLVKAGIHAVEKIRDSGITVELRWGPDTEFVQGSRRARHAARRGASHISSTKQRDTVLEVQSITKQARARAKGRPRPAAIVLPCNEVSDHGVDILEP